MRARSANPIRARRRSTPEKPLRIRSDRSDSCSSRIILLRHGHVEGISPERFRGRRDVDLSELGVRQAHAAAQRITARWHPQALYSSPLRRCLQTAAPIGAACGLAPTVLDDLNDVHYGEWEWRTYEEVRRASPELFACWFAAPQLVRFPAGESLQDLVSRAANVLRLIRERHAGQTVVLVGHGAGNRALLLQLLDQPLSAYWRVGQDPGALSEIELLEYGATVHRLNESCS